MNTLDRMISTIVIIASIVLPACAEVPRHDVSAGEYTVAVLPVYNATNDIDGPVVVRRLFNRKLQGYYATLPLNTVDEILRDRAGVTLGGQLTLIDPGKLGEILGVDGLVYGYLLNFEDVKTIVYNVRRVRVAFKLVDTKTGSTVWSRGGGVRIITGIFNAVAEDEGLRPYRNIKDIEKIPGINQWHDRLNTAIIAQKGDLEAVIGAAFIGAGDAVLSLGFEFIGFGSQLALLANDATNRIVSAVVEGWHDRPKKPDEVPKLVFPAFTLFKGIDFTANALLKTSNLLTGEESLSRIRLVKKGGRLRSDRTLGDRKFSVIVDRDALKGTILFPDSGQYAELNLARKNFEDVRVTKVSMGQETIDGRTYDRYWVTVSYSDTSIEEGMLWESADTARLLKKVDLKDLNTGIILEMQDIDTSMPSDDEFLVPPEYVKRPIE